MKNLTKSWNPKQARLKTLLSAKNGSERAVKLCLEMYAMTHCSRDGESRMPTIEDRLWDKLPPAACCFMRPKPDATIAWNLWHLTRIEDLMTSILILDDRQVLDKAMQKRLNIQITDCGNSMTRDQIKTFSSNIDISVLREYRAAVGDSGRRMMMRLTQDDLERKVDPKGIDRIRREGGVDPESAWLLDYWSDKTIAGLLLMPFTRHQIVHLNDCFKIKEKYLSQKKKDKA
jgi:hypothetical protein